MYDKIFHMKFLPPGRGLWAMGSPLTEDSDSRVYAALNNCAFVSTLVRTTHPSNTFPFVLRPRHRPLPRRPFRSYHNSCSINLCSHNTCNRVVAHAPQQVSKVKAIHLSDGRSHAGVSPDTRYAYVHTHACSVFHSLGWIGITLAVAFVLNRSSARIRRVGVGFDVKGAIPLVDSKKTGDVIHEVIVKGSNTKVCQEWQQPHTHYY
jgi:hypothetical protein